MLNFLFWNINKQPLTERIARLVQHHQVDVLVLAESTLIPEELCGVLCELGIGRYTFPPTLARKLRVVSRLDPALFTDLFNEELGALSIRRLRVGPHPGILLAVAHFPAPIDWEPEDYAAWLPSMSQAIQLAEENATHTRTVLVGDLNINPFDAGATSALGLNAVMTQSIAMRGSRTVRGRACPFFYNPMWGHFGDRTEGPPGSYYLHSSAPSNHYWQAIDQVLVRPSLMNHLSRVRILDHDGTDSLLTADGLPDKTSGSDHLPLLFSLDL